MRTFDPNLWSRDLTLSKTSVMKLRRTQPKMERSMLSIIKELQKNARVEESSKVWRSESGNGHIARTSDKMDQKDPKMETKS